MDVDGPPEVADGKSGVAVQEEARWRQKEPATAAAALVAEGVELPNVQAPTDLPQVGGAGWRLVVLVLLLCYAHRSVFRACL